ncbi:hypothetical protein [Thermococcus sp.]
MSSATRRKGQIAIEALFIMAIILTGIAIIVPPYLNENSATSVLVYVKSSASNACSYINSGVVVERRPYTILNPVIEKSNYTSPGFKVLSVTEQEDGNEITISVEIGYSGEVGLTNDSIAMVLKEFVVNDLVTHTDVNLNGNALYYNDKRLSINIRVVRV